jgi:hypothetical protein
LHPTVAEALYNAGWHPGTAIASIMLFLDPRWIVLGGAITETEPFQQALTDAIERNASAHVSLHLKAGNVKISTWPDLAPDWRTTPT